MEYNPDIHHRRSIRLKGYDYSQEGMYFITICVQNRDCLFGEIVTNVGADLGVCPNDITEHNEGEHEGSPQPGSPQRMKLNDAGKMVEKWVHELENKFPDIKCGEFVVMPNHFHCIIINTSGNTGNDMESVAHGGAPLRGRSISDEHRPISDEHRPISDEHRPISDEHRPISDEINKYGPDNKKYNVTIGDVLDWFKTMSTNEYIRGVKTLGWRRFDGKLWQRNYWEHIIQDDQSFENILKYIINNPQNWDNDKLK
jgi:REP element-mobilizing transposase RayT